LLAFAKAHARPTAILLDEFDASGLECTPNDVKCRRPWLTACSLKLMYRHDANSGSFRKLILTPGQ
jgi:hypothetical protein